MADVTNYDLATHLLQTLMRSCSVIFGRQPTPDAGAFARKKKTTLDIMPPNCLLYLNGTRSQLQYLTLSPLRFRYRAKLLELLSAALKEDATRVVVTKHSYEQL